MAGAAGAAVSICRIPTGFVAAPEQVSAVARRIADRCAVQVEGRHRKVAGVLSGANRVTKGQSIAAGAARVACGPTTVERQRWYAARNRDHLARAERQRDHVAGIEVTVATCIDPAAGCRNRWHRRGRRIDPQNAGRVRYCTRNIGVVACGVADRCSVQVEGRHRKVAAVLSGANRVAEGQSVAAGAARVACSATTVERQRWYAARNRDHLAHGERQRDHVAGIEITIATCIDPAARDRNRWHRRCRRIDLQDSGWVGHCAQ